MRYPIGMPVALLAPFLLAGCGLHTPDLALPWQNTNDVKISVNHIINDVKCELAQGVQAAINEDRALAAQNGTARKLEWLEDWSAKVTLTLEVEEASLANPSLTFLDPLSTITETFSNGSAVAQPRSIAVTTGFGISSTATRTEKLDFFVVFDDFVDKGGPNMDLMVPCQHFYDSPLASDLKLAEWIGIAVFANYTDSIATPLGYTFPMSVIQHQVKFLVKTSGSVTPAWRLVPVSFNQGNLPFLQFSRNKSHDILITMGAKAATDAVKRPGATTQRQTSVPSQAVINSHLASEIGQAVSRSLSESR